MEITLLKFDTEQPFSELEKYLPLLSPERRERTERLIPEQSKVTSLLSGLLLSVVLSERCGVACDKLRFAYGEHGKPYLPEYPECHFSLSHSGDYIALVCGNVECGLDVQKISCRKLHVLRFLHPAERQSIAEAQNSNDEFYRIWTMKEAYVKLTGEGMSHRFDSFDVLSMHDICFYTQRIGDHMLTLCTNKSTINPEIHTITENEIFDCLFIDEIRKVW